MSASKWCLYFVRAAWKGDVVMREEPLIPWVVCHTRCASAFKYKACSKLTRCLRCLRNPGPGLLVLAGTEWPFLPREMHQKIRPPLLGPSPSADCGLPCFYKVASLFRHPPTDARLVSPSASLRDGHLSSLVSRGRSACFSIAPRAPSVSSCRCCVYVCTLCDNPPRRALVRRVVQHAQSVRWRSIQFSIQRPTPSRLGLSEPETLLRLQARHLRSYGRGGVRLHGIAPISLVPFRGATGPRVHAPSIR